MDVIIRPITLEDYRDVTRFLFVQSEEDSVKAEIIENLDSMRMRELMRCVADVDRRTIGQVTFRKFKSSIKTHLVEITAMVVTGDYQGKGISSRLMKYGLDWAKGEGIEKAILSVRKGTKAESVYGHQGFHVYGELKEGIKEPWGGRATYDEVLMYKNLREV